jgi:hypothetical protein
MRPAIAAFVFSMGLLAAPAACEAKVQITVDLSTQTMNVDSASGAYSWPVSSARDGFVTPRGAYGVQRLETMHYSKKYHNSPMPHSIFFHGGYAIHGTYDLANLGRPASHGCVRISPANAATLYALVQKEGATIHIVGDASNATIARSLAPDEARPATPRGVAARSSAPQRVAAVGGQNDTSLGLVFGFATQSPSAEQPRARARR